jgi:hypothetical protein
MDRPFVTLVMALRRVANQSAANPVKANRGQSLQQGHSGDTHGHPHSYTTDSSLAVAMVPVSPLPESVSHCRNGNLRNRQNQAGEGLGPDRWRTLCPV